MIDCNTIILFLPITGISGQVQGLGVRLLPLSPHWPRLQEGGRWASSPLVEGVGWCGGATCWYTNSRAQRTVSRSSRVERNSLLVKVFFRYSPFLQKKKSFVTPPLHRSIGIKIYVYSSLFFAPAHTFAPSTSISWNIKHALKVKENFMPS